MVAYGVIVLGVAAALFFAFRPVQSTNTQHGTEGCGDPAVSIVINGEGSNVVVGKPGKMRTLSSQCYRDAVYNLDIAGVLFVVTVTLVVVIVYRARRDPTMDSD